jgi:hypothetical protein
MAPASPPLLPFLTVTKDKNIQPNTNRNPPETSTGKTAAEGNTCIARAFSRNPPYVERPSRVQIVTIWDWRSKRWPTFARPGRENPRHVLVTRRTGANHMDTSSDHRDRRRPATALKNFQPSLVDLALTTSPLETTNTRRSPRTWTRKSSICTNTQ